MAEDYKCTTPRCRGEPEIHHYELGWLCWKCWEKHCDEGGC